MLLKILVLLPLVALTVITIIAWHKALRSVGFSMSPYPQPATASPSGNALVTVQTRQCHRCGVYVPTNRSHSCCH